MAYKITGWLEEAARILVFKESDWSLETTTSIGEGEFEISSLTAGTKMIAGRRVSDGKVEVYGNIIPLEYIGEDFLAINALGDLLNINDAGDHMIIGIP
jgi:hypothetical protein